MRHLGLLVALVTLSVCGGDRDASVESRRFEQVRSHPVLELDVPGAAEGAIKGNAGGDDGRWETSTKAFRTWEVPEPSAILFADVIRQVRSTGVVVLRVVCLPTQYLIDGRSSIGEGTAGITVSLTTGAPGTLRATVTLGHDSVSNTQGSTVIDGECGEDIAAAVGDD